MRFTFMRLGSLLTAFMLLLSVLMAGGPAVAQTAPIPPRYALTGGTGVVEFLTNDGKSRVVVEGTSTAPTAPKAGGGKFRAPMRAQTMSTRTVTAEGFFWCGPVSPNGWCLAWRYQLVTDWWWEGGFVYNIQERTPYWLYSGYGMAWNNYGHYNTARDPGTGWSTAERSWSDALIQRWANNVVVDDCRVEMTINVDGWGGPGANWWTAWFTGLAC